MPTLDDLKSISPQKCRFLARTGPNNRQRPMTNDEIVARARNGGFSLSRASVAKFSQLTSWDSMTIEKAKAWIIGTGIDPLCCKTRKITLNLFRGSEKISFMRNATPVQKGMLDRILLSEASRPDGQTSSPNGHVAAYPKSIE